MQQSRDLFSSHSMSMSTFGSEATLWWGCRSHKHSLLFTPPPRRCRGVQKWLLGFFLIVVGSVLDFVAFGLAPQSFLAPLAGECDPARVLLLCECPVSPLHFTPGIPHLCCSAKYSVEPDPGTEVSR